jgi:membrane-associated phospholipid phosphatase
MALGLFAATEAAGLLVQYPCALLARPLIDGKLAYADQWMGFDWPDLYRFILGRPQLAAILQACYQGLLPVCVLVIGCAAMLNPSAARRFTIANAMTLAIALAVSALWPAMGPGVYFHAQAIDVSAVDLVAARAGTMTFHLSGLVTFPSYHAALALLCALALPYGPVWVAAGLIVVSAPVFGGHYLVDIVAGLGLAVGCWALAGRWARRGGRPLAT